MVSYINNCNRGNELNSFALPSLSVASLSSVNAKIFRKV